MNTSLTLNVPTSSSAVLRSLSWACALVLTGVVGMANASTVTLTASSFADQSVVGTVDGLTFGSASTTVWYAAGNPLRTFQIGSPLPVSQSNAYVFLQNNVAQDFRLESLTIQLSTRNDVSRGWFNFYDNGQLVATGEKNAKVASTVTVSQDMSFSLAVGGATQQTLSFAKIAGLYDRVTLNFDNGKAVANEVGITAFTVTGNQIMSTPAPVPVPAPVPEPSTYAMMLAGVAAIGFMSRRRKGVDQA